MLKADFQTLQGGISATKQLPLHPFLMIIKKAFFAALALAFPLMSATAQETGITSPYSRYGLGLLGHNQTGFNSSMAGVGIGTARGNEVNPINPASYGQIDSLSFIFDIGASLQQSRYTSGKAHVNATTATLDYATIGWKAARNLGMSIGVMPFSSVGYNTAATKTISENYSHADDVSATSSYKGTGGLHKVYLGAGWKPWRYISVGANVGFLWGNMGHVSSITYSDASVTSSMRNYNSKVRSYSVEAGLQAYIPLGKTDRLTLGANYSLGHNVNCDALMVVGSDSTTVEDAYQLPHTIGAGLSWEHKGRLRLAADYELQKWGDCRSPWLSIDAQGHETFASNKGYLRNSHRIALGFEYRPMKKGTTWHEYVTYRCGFALTTPYADVVKPGTTALDKGPTSYLATAGVNLPIMNVFGGRCSVNAALQYERVQPAFAGQIKENYFRLCIGVNFNEEWFTKWKVR